MNRYPVTLTPPVAQAPLLSAVLWACLACSHLPAATYFVATSVEGELGTAPSNGSEAKPWPTLAYALSQMQSGDTLYVKSGLYQQADVLIPSALSGTPANPTRIQAWPGDSVVLCGGGLPTGQVRIRGCDNLVLAGFTITNWSRAVTIESSTNVAVQHCFIGHVGQSGIQVSAHSRQIVIQGCVVSNAGFPQANGAAISIGSGPNGPLDNTSHVAIRSNVIHHTTGPAVQLMPGTHDCSVERNTICHVEAGENRGAIEMHEATSGVQQWAANPNHVVNGNLLHDTGTAIRAGTGCRIVNNLIYNLTSGACGILVSNHVGDGYPAQVYHNTIDAPVSSAVFLSAGSADLQNNLGPSQTNNLPVDASCFVNAVGRDYHLAPGSPPVDAGVDLSSIVPEDIEGTRRPRGRGVDFGAYERVPARPAPPGGLRVTQTRP